MLLLITASLILCGNVFIVKAEDITTMHYPWSPVSHKSDGIVRSYDVSGGTFIKNNMDDYETDAMNTYVGDHEPPDDRNKLSKMSIHCNSYIRMTIQNNPSELPVAKMKMVPSRPHKIFDGGVVMITLNDDVPTNDAYKINVFDTPDVFRPCECRCNNEDSTFTTFDMATVLPMECSWHLVNAYQDRCNTCCIAGCKKPFPGVVAEDDSYQMITNTSL